MCTHVLVAIMRMKFIVGPARHTLYDVLKRHARATLGDHKLVGSPRPVLCSELPFCELKSNEKLVCSV